MNRRYLKDDVEKMISDNRIKRCSLQELGMLTWLRWLMHTSDDYGCIKVSAAEVSERGSVEEAVIAGLQILTSFKRGEISRAVYGLIEKGIVGIQGRALVSYQMLRDYELSVKRAEAGLKGAKSRKTDSNKSEEIKPLQRDLFGQEDIPQKPSKHIYGECKNVRLTDKEYKKLSESYGEDGVKEIIRILDNYKEAKGVSYKSDYRAILNWVADRYKENLKRKEYQNGAQGRTDNGRTDYQQEEFQKHILDKLGM